jgi:hypothetical protein
MSPNATEAEAAIVLVSAFHWSTVRATRPHLNPPASHSDLDYQQTAQDLRDGNEVGLCKQVQMMEGVMGLNRTTFYRNIYPDLCRSARVTMTCLTGMFYG